MTDSNDTHPDDGFLDRLLDVPSLIAPSVSPSGLVVAWSWGGRGAAAEAYLRSSTGDDEPLRLHGAGEDIVVQSWRPDSAEFLLALTRDGTERVRLMRAAIAKMAPVPVTQAEPNFYIFGGELHPNGRWVVFAANLDPATGGETEVSRVFRQDLVSGERLVLAKPQRANQPRPMVNAQGTHVLYSRKDRHPAGRQY